MLQTFDAGKGWRNSRSMLLQKCIELTPDVAIKSCFHIYNHFLKAVVTGSSVSPSTCLFGKREESFRNWFQQPLRDSFATKPPIYAMIHCFSGCWNQVRKLSSRFPNKHVDGDTLLPVTTAFKK